MDIENICKQTIKVVKETGNFIRQESFNLSRNNIETKGLHDYVTYVDKSSEERLTKELTKVLPDSGFITEEDTIKDKTEEYTWIIDPLDGTTNYVHSVPLYSISIALQRNGQTIMGIVYEIVRDECFYAWEGSPVYLNGKSVQVTETKTLNKSLFATGFPYYDYSRIKPYINFFTYLLENTIGVRRLGSAAVDLAYVACGRYDGFYEYSLHAWDVAAGAFLVQQAGGKVCDFSGGKNFIYGAEIIATNHHIHEKFMDKMQLYFQ